ATLDPVIAAPEAYAGRDWSRDDALTEILRGRGFETKDLVAGLAALQTEGFALHGRFTPGATEDEWCERRLLARIHRYTIKRLRRALPSTSRPGSTINV